MSDFYSPAHFSVVNEILPGWKASFAWFDVITRPPGFRVLSEQPETLYNGIDQSVRDIHACPFRPISKYFVQIVLGLLRDSHTIWLGARFGDMLNNWQEGSRRAVPG